MVRSTSQLCSTALGSAITRLPPTSNARFASSTATAAATPPTPTNNKTHYLITLLRSPLHLPTPLSATCTTLGLTHRLQSSLLPITPINAGLLLRVKELVGVKLVSVEDFEHKVGRGWREREGEGRRGSGLSARGWGGTVRVGSERCRGEERGFKVVQRT